jgi:hypothetical protein
MTLFDGNANENNTIGRRPAPDKWHCRPCLHDAIFAGMSITATVEQEKIVLPANVPWPSGTVVRIEPMGDQPPTFWQSLKDFDGIANDLTADLGANLDRYVHE